jgi:hypothetical protein
MARFDSAADERLSILHAAGERNSDAVLISTAKNRKICSASCQVFLPCQWRLKLLVQRNWFSLTGRMHDVSNEIGADLGKYLGVDVSGCCRAGRAL